MNHNNSLFYSKENFISLFKSYSNTFEMFIDDYNVRVRKKLVPLKDYIKYKNINLTVLKKLYLHIVNNREYLSRFYNTSLSIKENIKFDREPMTKYNINNNKFVNFKNIIRNLHLLDILKNTKSGIENNPTFMDVLEDIYNNHIIDYKILTPSALHYIDNGRIGSVYSSFYFRASIMNPYIVYSLNHNVLKGTRIFTPTLGWSSYAYGFMESPNVSEYVGTDVIKDVCSKTRTFLKLNYPLKKHKIYQSPSENLLNNKHFKTNYKEHFDLVFFSPPYYKMELYPGDKQSTTKYGDYDTWLKIYWEKTIQLCLHVLSPGSKMCYILSGYGSKNTGSIYNLIDDMNKITEKYFIFEEIIPLYNKNVHVTEHRETAEKIIIFHKP